MVLVIDYLNGSRQYVVRCDECGREHPKAGATARDAATNAAASGWHCPTPFLGESSIRLPVKCPRCHD